MTNLTIVIPDQADIFTKLMLFALTVWRESSGEPMEAKVAVAWSIQNRELHPSWWGKTIPEIVTKKWQYTSMHDPTGRDPNLTRYPMPNDKSWQDSLRACFDVLTRNVPDPTSGSTHYHDDSLHDDTLPPWAKTGRHMTTIGSFRFYQST